MLAKTTCLIAFAALLPHVALAAQEASSPESCSSDSDATCVQTSLLQTSFEVKLETEKAKAAVSKLSKVKKVKTARRIKKAKATQGAKNKKAKALKAHVIRKIKKALKG